MTTTETPTATGIRARIARRPLTWFFGSAFLLSWLAWTPYVLSENGIGLLPFRFPTFLGTSQFAGVLPGAYLGPILSAFLVTAAAGGRAGLRTWAARLVRFRVNWRWYVIVLVGVPGALTLAAIPASGGHVAFPTTAVLVAYLPALVLQMLTTGLAEEPGWRDFALPRLQDRFGPLKGTLVLGPLWGAWHLPLFLSDWGGPDVTWSTPVEFVVTATAFSFVMTWVFNRSGESLPLAMLLHTSVNNFFSVAWSQVFPTIPVQDTAHVFLATSVAAAVIVVVATRGRLGYDRRSTSFK